MNRLSKAILVLLGAVLMLVATAAAQADDVLRFRVITNGGRAYEYWKFSNASRTLAAGDYIEYDVYLHDNTAGVGGIDMYFTDGTYMRDTAGWADQNGIGGHPSADLRSRAYGKWYHRKLAVPASKAGKTISFWDMAVDGTYSGYAYEVPSAMYNNVCVTNGSGTTYLWAYQDGNPSQNVVHFNLAGSIQSAQMFPTTTRKSSVQVSSYLFYWYDAPNGNATPSAMMYDPHGLSTGGPWSGYGNGYYTSQNVAWWEGVFQDMKRAGIDVADVVCFGNWYLPYFQIWDLSTYMVPALERSGADVKIALFDDTTSEVSQWNNDNGRGYVTTPQMPLSNTGNWGYFYNNKILPFFQAIPQKFWATHNGASVDAGGKPIIVVYTAGNFTDVNTYGASLWSAIKTTFARDFKNSLGQDIVPFIMLERSWYDMGGGGSGDAEYQWGAALNGPTVFGVNGFYTGAVGPGYDDRLIRTQYSQHDRAMSTWLQCWYSGQTSGKYMWDCNYILEETWNELWEGSAIERCVNYTDSDAYADPGTWGPTNRPGNPLAETFYMDAFGQRCVTTSVGRRDYDATFLRTWEIPTTITRGVSSIPTTVRNDGFLPWDPNGTYPVRVGFWLEDANGNQIPNTGGRLYLPSTVLIGQETAQNWTAPASWPTGSYYLRLDMVADGSTWFSWQGDTPVKVAVTIN